MNSIELTAFFTDEINNLLSTGKTVDITDELKKSIHGLESHETKNLFLTIIELITGIDENQKSIVDLSNGKLDETLPSNALAAPFKQLHANLSHLAWQVQRIAEGDLNQQVDFMGNFSLHFNALIKSLKEKQHIELDFKNSAEKYRISIENANIGIMTIGIDGYIQTTNKECVSILGFSQPELEQMAVNDFTIPEDKEISVNFMKAAIENKDKSKAEFVKRFIHHSGKIVTCQISSSLMHDENKQPLFFISHIKDISIRTEQEQVLKELNTKLSETVSELKIANAAKDKFFRIIAHDLKNPFNNILGLSDLLLNHTNPSNTRDVRHITSTIHYSTQEAYKLLENLLTWSMSQTNCIPFKPQNHTLHEIIKDVVGLAKGLAQAKNIS